MTDKSWSPVTDVQDIEGVEFKKLVSHPDDRGFFREVLRVSDDVFAGGFGQWSHSKMACHTVKAWHFHHRQVDWWYVPIGYAQVVLVDLRKNSPTFGIKSQFILGEPELFQEAQVAVVRIPQGVAHGCRVISDIAHLFYITSQVYDPQDEGRIPFNSGQIDYFWGDENEIIVSERDRKQHVPPYSL